MKLDAEARCKSSMKLIAEARWSFSVKLNELANTQQRLLTMVTTNKTWSSLAITKTEKKGPEMPLTVLEGAKKVIRMIKLPEVETEPLVYA
jgi:hypothetical protein